MDAGAPTFPSNDDEKQGRAPQDDASSVPELLKASQTVVDVQKHFNDLELRTRNLAITLLGATMAAVGYLSKDPEPGNGREDWSIHFRLFGFEVAPPIALFSVALILVLAFWIMDRHWYHRLLVDAVKVGEEMEERLAAQGLKVDLAHKIRMESAIRFFGTPEGMARRGSVTGWLSRRRLLRRQFQGRELQSYGRVDLFYLVLATLCLMAIAASLPGWWCTLPLAVIPVLWRVWWETAFTSPGTGY